MSKKVIVKPTEILTDAESSRLKSELDTIGGFDFVIEVPKAKPVSEPKPEQKTKPKEDTPKTK